MNIKDYNIADVLPESINRDNVREVAKVVDEKLHELDAMSELVSIYPRIDKLSSNLIDALAIQLHVDFYNTTLPLDKRRTLVKNSILWHMKKGTKLAVEGVVSAAFESSTVQEWYEYGGSPYHFKITTECVTTEKGVLDEIRRAIDSVKNVRSWLDKIEFLLHLRDDIDREDFDDESVIYVGFNTNGKQSKDQLADEYPWPAKRKLDGSWTLGGSRYLDGKDKLDGTWMLDGLKNGLVTLNDSIETLKVTCIQFINGALSDTFGKLGRKLDGSWQLNGRNHLGSDALPMDIGGRITVRNRHLLNGTWRLDGGERNLLDGTIPLDGRFKLDGGGRKLTQGVWTDFLDGAKTNVKPSKLLPSKWLHPAWHDDVEASDGMSVWRTLKGVNASENTARPIGFDEHLPLDGSWELGDNVTPADASGGLEIRQYKRLNGTWCLDGGNRLRLDGKFALDGKYDLRQRGNRFAIRKRAVTM